MAKKRNSVGRERSRNRRIGPKNEAARRRAKRRKARYAIYKVEE